VLDSGDMIVATFNEAINGYKMSALNIKVKNLSKNQTVPAAFGCSGNVVTIIPDLEGESFEGDTFNIELTGLEDMYGNVMPEAVSWAFVINADPTPPDDADTDNDGILNNADNCPWSYNPLQEDMDSDTYGDACDDDIDGDGVLNVTDNCLMTENPLQEDINADGIGDACQDLTGLDKPQPVESFRFYENYPNPFSEKTTLTYTVPFESHIIMKVFDIVGHEVAILINKDVLPGTWEVTWDSQAFGDGIYFCTIYAESNVTNDVAIKTIKMLKAR
jgi:hypothetical protein